MSRWPSGHRRVSDDAEGSVYHRTAGQDRTGWAGATVMADYLASNDYRAEYLGSGFREVEDEFGSFAAYERRALGLDSRGLRELKADLLVG